MKQPEVKLVSPDQLCDVLEVYLGREKGQAKCRELLTRLEDDPDWRLQLKTLGCTVQVFQRIEKDEVPEDVKLRLLDVLNLSGKTPGCGDE